MKIILDTNKLNPKKLFKIGTSQNLELQELKRIILTNQINAIFIGVASIYVFIFYGLGYYQLMGLMIGMACCFLINVVLSYFKQHHLVAWCIIIGASLGMCLFASALGKDSGIQYGLFTILPISFALLKSSDKLGRKLGIIIPIFLYYCLEARDYSFFYKELLTTTELEWIHYSVIITVFSVLFLTLNFAFTVSDYTNSLLKNSLKFNNLTQRENELLFVLLEGKAIKKLQKPYILKSAPSKTTSEPFLKSYRSVAELNSLLSYPQYIKRLP